VRRALDCHEEGDFTESGKLARSFDRDDRISPCLTDRENALVGGDSAKFEFQAAEKAKNRSKPLIQAVNDWYPKACSSAWTRKTLRQAITMGFSLSNIAWSRTPRKWVPSKLTVWEPENVFWSEVDQLYVARTVDGLLLPIVPGDPNWFLYAPSGDRSWMSGSVRPLGIPFVMRSWDLNDWARYNERHGLPIVAIKEPSGLQNEEDKDDFYASVKRMGSTGIVRLPQSEGEGTSYGLELIEAKAKSHDSFNLFLDRLNTAIAICLKGQNLSTEVQGGAYASTAWHMRVRKDYAATDAVTLGDALRESLIKPWGRLNVSSWDDEIAPWPTWCLEIPEDRQAIADATLKSVQALQAIASNAAIADQIDIEALIEQLGLPRRKGAPAELEIEEPPKPAPEEEAPAPPPN
jgi:phage gp29-like protein